jgi:hypothetical protein
MGKFCAANANFVELCNWVTAKKTGLTPACEHDDYPAVLFVDARLGKQCKSASVCLTLFGVAAKSLWSMPALAADPKRVPAQWRKCSQSQRQKVIRKEVRAPPIRHAERTEVCRYHPIPTSPHNSAFRLNRTSWAQELSRPGRKSDSSRMKCFHGACLCDPRKGSTQPIDPP